VHFPLAVLFEGAKVDELARRARVALVLVLDGVALVLRLQAVAPAAARRRRGGRSIGGGHITVAGILRHQKGAALLLAARLVIVQFAAFVVRFVAVAHAAADRLRRGGRGGPHCLAVLVLAERLKVATRLAIVIRQHQALLLGAELFAALHPALAVRDVGVTVAAAGLRRRIRVHVPHAVDFEGAPFDEMARRAAVALVLILDAVALVVCHEVGCSAAARRRGGGGSVSGGHLAIARVIRHQKAAAHVLAARLRGGFGATIVRFVAIAVAAARRLSRRLGRGGPQHRAVAILIHRLEHAARHSVAVRQHQTLALSAERDARLLVFLAVRLVGVDVAAARLLRRRLLE